MNKIIVAGSRSINDYNLVKQAILESKFTIDELVSGGAFGVDKLGEKYAQEHNIPIKRFLPDYSKFNKLAPLIRNKEMSEYGSHLIAVYDGTSRGTANMIKNAENNQLQIFIKVISTKTV